MSLDGYVPSSPAQPRHRQSVTISSTSLPAALLGQSKLWRGLIEIKDKHAPQASALRAPGLQLCREELAGRGRQRGVCLDILRIKNPFSSPKNMGVSSRIREEGRACGSRKAKPQRTLHLNFAGGIAPATAPTRAQQRLLAGSLCVPELRGSPEAETRLGVTMFP